MCAQIYVEIERARLTKRLAMIEEAKGNVSEAADILQEVAVVRRPLSWTVWSCWVAQRAKRNFLLLVNKLISFGLFSLQETFGAMAKEEKISFILGQVRATLITADLSVWAESVMSLAQSNTRLPTAELMRRGSNRLQCCVTLSPESVRSYVSSFSAQVRLCLARKDYVRAQILIRKVSPRAFVPRPEKKGEAAGEVGIEGTTIEVAAEVSHHLDVLPVAVGYFA